MSGVLLFSSVRRAMTLIFLRHLVFLFILNFGATCSLDLNESTALCGLINSTTIEIVYPEWNCQNVANACISKWSTITCGSGHVISISLDFGCSSTQLRGSLGSTFGDLTYLRTLNLQVGCNSSFGYPLPKEMGKLTALKSLKYGIISSDIHRRYFSYGTSLFHFC